MTLFHFSEDPGIVRFAPRAVRVPSRRPPGREWLNGPLVWAIDSAHQALYLFPRDCPRILIWPVTSTTVKDRARWFPGPSTRMIAHIEQAWMDRVRSGHIHRYALPDETFESLDDAGMWVSRKTVSPTSMEPITDLPGALAEQGVELRVLADFASLAGIWDTSLHASGIRLRNASGWGHSDTP